MSDFLQAFERMIVNEGGYKLHTVAGDRGGMTYAGISRNNWPNWPGWSYLDSGDTPPAEMVRGFYRSNFWTPLRLEEVQSQDMARTLFDFAVNAGTSTAAKLAQIVIGTTPDGKVGPKTLAALNNYDADLFMARYALAKIARYEQIVTKDRSQGKFLLGWVRRTLKEAA
jgi:lysozyme family protein